MGSVIHMDTEQVRSVARQLNQASSDIQQDILFVGNRLRSLNWQSPSRDRFISDVAELQRKVQAHAEMGVELGLRMQREVDEWERVDNSWSGTAGAAGMVENTTGEGYDWGIPITFAGSLIGFGFESVDDLSEIYLRNYATMGRGLNWFFETRGWVSDMQDFGRLTRNIDDVINANNGLNILSDTVPFVFGIYSDLRDGDSWRHAIGSEALEFVVEKGIQKALYGIPILGQAYLFYDVALSAGSLAASGLDLVGLHEQAVWLESAVDTLDVVDKASDWAIKTAEYYFTHTDKVMPDLASTADQVVDFSAGLVDGSADWVGSASESIGDFFGW